MVGSSTSPSGVRFQRASRSSTIVGSSTIHAMPRGCLTLDSAPRERLGYPDHSPTACWLAEPRGEPVQLVRGEPTRSEV